METKKRSRYKKPAVAIAIVAVIVGLLWAGGQYQVALVVLSISSLVLIVSSMLAIATLREQVSDNEFAALHDPLTELPNRLLFQTASHQAILAARRDRHPLRGDAAGRRPLQGDQRLARSPDR